jgi:hypothetical protein
VSVEPSGRPSRAILILSWLASYVWVRPLLGLLGISGLVIGSVLAWQEGAATSILVVSGVLLVVALIPKGLEELRAEHGQTALAMKWARDEIREVAEVEAPEASEHWSFYRERLEAAEQKLDDALRTQQRESGRWFRRRRPMTTPVHRITAEEVLLELRATDYLTNVACLVMDPGAMEYRTAVSDPIPLGLVAGKRIFEWRCRYPRDFSNAPALEPGLYRVAWFEKTSDWHLEIPDSTVWARDVFTVPDTTQ